MRISDWSSDVCSSDLRGLFLFRHFGDEGLGSDEERGDRGRVLQRGTHDLGRVDHTGLDEILVLAGRCVEAPVVVVALEQLADDPGAVLAGVLGDLSRSEEHTSELQSLMRISYAVFCLKKKKTTKRHKT